jgi:hypothetical protein
MITAIVALSLLSILLAIHSYFLTIYCGHVVNAAEQLYFATYWQSSEPNKLSKHIEAKLWQHLRDALMLEPGSAAARGVGDPNA